MPAQASLEVHDRLTANNDEIVITAKIKNTGGQKSDYQIILRDSHMNDVVVSNWITLNPDEEYTHTFNSEWGVTLIGGIIPYPWDAGSLGDPYSIYVKDRDGFTVAVDRRPNPKYHLKHVYIQVKDKDTRNPIPDANITVHCVDTDKTETKTTKNITIGGKTYVCAGPFEVISTSESEEERTCEITATHEKYGTLRGSTTFNEENEIQAFLMQPYYEGKVDGNTLTLTIADCYQDKWIKWNNYYWACSRASNTSATILVSDRAGVCPADALERKAVAVGFGVTFLNKYYFKLESANPNVVVGTISTDIPEVKLEDLYGIVEAVYRKVGSDGVTIYHDWEIKAYYYRYCEPGNLTSYSTAHGRIGEMTPGMADVILRDLMDFTYYRINTKYGCNYKPTYMYRIKKEIVRKYADAFSKSAYADKVYVEDTGQTIKEYCRPIFVIAATLLPDIVCFGVPFELKVKIRNDGLTTGKFMIPQLNISDTLSPSEEKEYTATLMKKDFEQKLVFSAQNFATGELTDEKANNIEVGAPQFSLDIDSPEAIQPGSDFSYKVKITNVGKCSGRFTIPELGESGELKPNESKEYEVKLTMPTNDFTKKLSVRNETLNSIDTSKDVVVKICKACIIGDTTTIFIGGYEKECKGKLLLQGKGIRRLEGERKLPVFGAVLTLGTSYKDKEVFEYDSLDYMNVHLSAPTAFIRNGELIGVGKSYKIARFRGIEDSINLAEYGVSSETEIVDRFTVRDRIRKIRSKGIVRRE